MQQYINFNLTLTNLSAQTCNDFQLILSLKSSDSKMNINITSLLTLDEFVIEIIKKK